MKEELLRVLNYKLNDIVSDINSLIELNNKIEEEKEKSSFVAKILDLFKENGSDNIMNFVKIEKDDFNRVLDLSEDDVKNVFGSNSCNYDGLVYLINGINSGVSLTLTDEQKNGIEYLIKSLNDKKKEFDSAIDGYTLVKSRYEINDVDELTKKKDEYQEVVDEIDKQNYLKDTNILLESIKFSDLSPEKTIDLLKYVLEYNADVYKKGKPVQEEKNEVEIPKPQEEKVEVEVPQEEPTEDEFHFNQVENDSIFEFPNIRFDDLPENKVEVAEETTVQTNEEVNDYIPDYNEYPVYQTPEEEVTIPNELTYVPENDEETENEEVNDNIEISEEVPEVQEEYQVESPAEEMVEESKEEPSIDTFEEQREIVEEPVEEIPIDNDFKDVIDDKEDYDEYEKNNEDEKTSTREFQKVFSKYGIEDNTVLNELIDGDVNEYQNILDSLKDHNILNIFKNNRELLVETLLYSNSDVIENVLNIVKEDLSVDDEDYDITLKILINTMPSVFVNEGGNYNNFVKNLKLFRELGINLINLFDFSKEVFIADNELVVKNADVINKYGFDINFKNAKYFLLIPNIADRLDYYIESVYLDKEKNEIFDGINYIKEYAAKLNVVTDETIKRLRYASENGKKVFGTKPGSLSGEITNLKVNALDISDDYLNKFFDNEFANLTGDETREYVKLVHNSSNVGDYSDELDKLNPYHDGLRYDIEGIKVSYNKVIRNYSILRSYGIDSKKALQFAVCYNLVITKEEYNKLNDLLERIGGNL